jgi:YHYH protein
MSKFSCLLCSSLFATVLSLSAAQAQVDPSLFSRDALVNDPLVVDCKLANGEGAKCVQLVVKYKPDTLNIGPFCPTTLSETGGVWDWDGDKPGVYRLNRTFFEMLNGMGYTFYDADGKVYIADPAVGRPANKNSCLMAKADANVQMTMLIPVNPKNADKATDLGTVAKVGVALDGVPIFSDAPSVLHTGHLPALDTCGGHIDPGGWYHWHGTATDIDTVYKHSHVDAVCASKTQSASAQFGYGFDGFAMYGSTEADGSAPAGLDACNGHVGPTAAHPKGEYHYHSTAEFPNLPRCLTGVQAKDNFKTTAKTGIGSPRPWWWPF